MQTTLACDDAAVDERPDTGGEDSVAPERPRWAHELAGIAALCGALAALVYRVWDRPLDVPFVHGGDHLAFVALSATVDWTGTPSPSEQLGAPWGVDWVDTPSGADRLSLIVLRFLRVLGGGDPVVAANLQLLAAIVAVGVVSYVVVRSLGRSAMTSTVAAVAVALAPAQLARAGVGHLLLVAYVSVPIGVWLALWASRAPGVGRWVDAARARRCVVPALLVVVLGSMSAYYAAFAVVGIAGLGAVLALRQRSWTALGRPAAVTLGTLVVVGVNIAGEVLARGGTESSTRVLLDVDAYGLRIAQLLLPVRGHRVDLLAAWADRAHRIAAPGDPGAAIGLVAVVGLVVVVVGCIRGIGRPGRSDASAPASVPPGTGEHPGPSRATGGLVARLGVLALVTFAVATTSGLSMVLATFGLTQIRAWSRASSVIGFVGVVGAALVLDALARRRDWSRPTRWAVGSLLVLFVLFDQVAPGALPDPATERATWAADAELAAQLEAALPADSMVFLLPVGTFPAELPVGAIGANELFGPPLAGSGELRWNVGAMKGSSGDWQRSAVALDTPDLLDRLAAAGFAAVALDRRALEPHPDHDVVGPGPELEAELVEQLGPPDGATAERTRVWWQLRTRRDAMVRRLGADRVERAGAAVTRPVGVVVEGSPGVRTTLDPRARHLGASAAIRLVDRSPDGSAGGPVRVTFTLSGEPGAVATVRSSEVSRRVVLAEAPTPVRLDLELPAGGSERIRIDTNARPLGGPPARWGDLRLLLADLVVEDPRADLGAP